MADFIQTIIYNCSEDICKEFFVEHSRALGIKGIV